MADDNEKFAWSVKNADFDTIDEFLKKKVDVNAVTNGRCPIHYAADYGHLKVIDLLLQNGADINKEDKYGITPILSAIFEGHTECVKMLLEKGAKKDGKSPDGATYVDCAEKQEIKDLLK